MPSKMIDIVAVQHQKELDSAQNLIKISEFNNFSRSRHLGLHHIGHMRSQPGGV